METDIKYGQKSPEKKKAMKVSSVLVLGTFGKGALENFYIAGFEKLGITVSRFDIATPYYNQLQNSVIRKVFNKISIRPFIKPLNNSVLAFLKDKYFDVILVFKGMELLPETVAQLQEHATVLANYNADHPFLFFSRGSGNSNVLKSIPHYNIHFSYAKRIALQLKQNFGKESFVVPFGYDSEAKGNSELLQNNFEDKFLFIGAYDKERSKYLNKLKLDSLEIYGDDKWATRNITRPYIREVFKNKSLFNEEIVNAIGAAKGIINLLRPQNIIEDSHNMRTFEVPAYGGLLIAQRTTEQEAFFEEDKEIVFFDSPEELRDKLLYVKNNPSVVNTIKSNARNRSIRSGYSYNDRSREMIDIIKKFI